MIVDCHTHVDLTADDTDAPEYSQTAETVEKCIVLAGSEGPSEPMNKKLAQYIHKHKEKRVGFAVVEPSKDKIDVNSLTLIQDKLGLQGVVLYCSACGVHPAHTRAIRLYESAQKLGLPIFFHNTPDTPKDRVVLEYAQPYLLDEVAREFADLKIVIGNMGMPFIEQTLSIVSRHKNVYADLTIRPRNVWQTYNMVVAAHEHGVMDKLLFGSGFPLGNAGQCIEALLGFNMLLADTNLPTVPRGSIRNIIERNTLKLLGIPAGSTETQDEPAEKPKERKTTKAKQDK